jgi:hypothetical protein
MERGMEEGALEEEGASSVGRNYTCKIVVSSISEQVYSSMLDYSGGVFISELPVGICNRFSGVGSIYEGRTMLGRTCLDWTCILA